MFGKIAQKAINSEPPKVLGTLFNLSCVLGQDTEKALFGEFLFRSATTQKSAQVAKITTKRQKK